MLLSNIRTFLKAKVNCPQWYIGKIDSAKEQCIGIYNAIGPAPVIAIGGLNNTSYAIKTISILVHWGKNADIAEQKAQEVFNCLFGQEAVIGNKRIIQFKMNTPEPISLGTDENGIYEYVIETTIFYER